MSESKAKDPGDLQAATEEEEKQPSWMRVQNDRGKAAYRLGLSFLQENASVVFFRILAVGISGFLGTVAMSTLAVTFLLTVTGEPLDEMIWLWRLVRLLREPAFMLGAAGVLASAAAASLLLDAYSEGLIWTAYRRARHGERARVFEQASHIEAARWTPSVMGWIAIRWLVRVACVLVGAGVYVGIVMLNLRWGGDTQAALALVSSLLYAAGLLYMILLNVTLEWVPACMIGGSGEPRGLGEALLEAAKRSIEELLSTYRLIVQSFGWALPALALTGLVFAGQVWFIESEETSQLLSMSRILADMLVTVSFAGVGVLVRVGLFELEADREVRSRGDGAHAKRSIQARAERAKELRGQREDESIYAHLGAKDEDGITRVDIHNFLPDESASDAPGPLSVREVMPWLFDATELGAASQEEE